MYCTFLIAFVLNFVLAMTASHDFEINLVQKVSVGFVEALYSPCYRLVKSGNRISINKKTREQFGEWIEM